MMQCLFTAQCKCYFIVVRKHMHHLLHLRAAAREPVTDLGRLVVLASPAGEPTQGASIGLDAITTLGRDVNNAIVVDDQFASAQHAVLTFRGRSWYLEDLGSTNGTYINGRPVAGVAPIGFGDRWKQLDQQFLRLADRRLHG